MGVTTYPEVKARHEEMVALHKLYDDAITEMFKGIPRAPDFPGWTDNKFHGLLARRMSQWWQDYEKMRVKGIKFDGACEFLANLVKSVNA